MFDKVCRTIEKYKLLTPGERVIVGFSGGVDSLSLLHILCHLLEYRLDIWAVYINHSLRPLENEQEIKLLEKLGMEWGIQTHIYTVNIPERLQKKPQSIQLLAREERYRIFQEFRSKIQADKIALAHHQDDQAETIMYRILRGTGLDGLAGIPIFRSGGIIRPLLEVSRQEIIRYANLHQLTWLEDSSNRKLIYQRNKIRLQLIPMIEETYNPRFREGLNRLAKLAAEQRDFMETIILQRSAELLVQEKERIGIRLASFLKQPLYFQYYLLKHVLWSIQKEVNLETAIFEKIRSKINKQGYQFTQMHIVKGVSIYREGELIYIGRAILETTGKQDFYSVEAPGTTNLPEIFHLLIIERALPPLTWTEVPNDEEYVDAAKITLPLQIRFWKPGDKFVPLGATGGQKLHDFFINHKIPRQQRRKVPLLVTADDRIVWIVGYRLSHDFKIDSQTKEVWKIKFIPFE